MPGLIQPTNHDERIFHTAAITTLFGEKHHVEASHAVGSLNVADRLDVKVRDHAAADNPKSGCHLRLIPR